MSDKPEILLHENKLKSNNKKKKRYRRRRKHHNHHHHQQKLHTMDHRHQSTHQQHHRQKHETNRMHLIHQPSSTAIAIWRNIYETTVKWHHEHQMNYWRNLAERRKMEMEKMKKELNSLRSRMRRRATLRKSIENIETKIECTAIQTDVIEMHHPDLDESYLQFMEVTERHRIDLAEQRLISENEELDDDA